MAQGDENPDRSTSLAVRPSEAMYIRAPEPPPPPEEGLEVGQLFRTLRAHKRTVFGIAGLVFGSVMALTLLSDMEFRANGRLYLGELGETKASEGPSLDLSGGDRGDVGSEIEILRSETLVTRAIHASGLNVVVAPESYSPPKYWAWLLHRRDPRLLDGASRVLAARSAGFSDDLERTASYTVKFVSERAYEVWSDRRLARGTLDQELAFDGARWTLTAGNAGAPAVGASYQITILPFADVYAHALKNLNVTSPKTIGTGEPVRVVTVEYAHASPLSAASFVRQLMLSYLEQRQTWRTEEASAAEAFVSSQVQSMRQELDQTQQKLADYRRDTPVVVMENEAKALIEQIGKYEEQRVAARLSVAALSEMKRALSSPNARMEAFLLGESSDTVLAGLAKSLSDARSELVQLEEKYNESAPNVRAQRAQVDAQLNMVRGYVTSRLTRAQESLSALNGVIAQFQSKLKTVPGAELGLSQIARESDVYSKLYSSLLERQQQAAITKASTVSKNRILDLPKVQYREAAPKLWLRLASGILGLLLGAIYVLARQRLSSRLVTENDVRRALPGYPIAALIPLRPSPRKADQEARTFDVLADDPRSPYPEAYRMLRAHLYYAAPAQRGQVVLVTSPTPGDGKTTCALALGAILAADGKLVLTIDADVRKPSHHEFTGRTDAPGLGSVLTGAVEWQRAVQRITLSSGELYSIGTGGMQSPEFLSSDELASFFHVARSRFDFVIIDAASFPVASDALPLSRSADQVISVVRLQHTPRRAAIEHARRLAPAARGYALVINGGEAGPSYGADSLAAGPIAKVRGSGVNISPLTEQ